MAAPGRPGRRPLRRPGRPGPVLRGSGGYATAELAVALPVLVVVLALALWGVAASVAKVKSVDAARVAARAMARGEPVDAALAAGRSAAPAGAEVSSVRTGDLVRVRVKAEIGFAGRFFRSLPAIGISAEAVAAVEGDR